jgi:hypothetical protein
MLNGEAEACRLVSVLPSPGRMGKCRGSNIWDQFFYLMDDDINRKPKAETSL